MNSPNYQAQYVNEDAERDFVKVYEDNELEDAVI